jgi:TolB-like protein
MRLDIRIVDVESGIILTAEKTEGKTDIKNIGTMADSIVADLVNRFYKEKK